MLLLLKTDNSILVYVLNPLKAIYIIKIIIQIILR